MPTGLPFRLAVSYHPSLPLPWITWLQVSLRIFLPLILSLLCSLFLLQYSLPCASPFDILPGCPSVEIQVCLRFSWSLLVCLICVDCQSLVLPSSILVRVARISIAYLLAVYPGLRSRIFFPVLLTGRLLIAKSRNLPPYSR